MASQITFDDGGGPVTGSQDNGSLTTISVSNFSDAGVLGWLWELVDRPQGSSATLTSTTVANPSFTADARGTYLLRLTTYTDASRTTVDDADEQLYAIRLEGSFDWRVPAAGETSQLNSTRGWADARETAIRNVHAFMNSGIPALTGVVNAEITGADPETVLGGFVLDASNFPDLALKLRVMGVLTLAGAGTGDLRLYDMGVVGGGAVVGTLRATATLANGTAGILSVTDTSLTPVAAPSTPGEIITARHRYELRAELVGGAGADIFKIHNGSITLEG